MPNVTKATWIAYGTDSVELARNTLSTSIALSGDKTPNDLLKTGQALATTLKTDANANATVANYSSPIPSTTLYRGPNTVNIGVPLGFVTQPGLARVEFFITEITGGTQSE